MKDLIRRVIKEEIKDKSVNQINKIGLYQFMKMSKMSFAKIFSIAGMDFLTNKIMIQFIKQVIDDNGTFSVYDFYIDPLPYNKTDSEYREISYFGAKFVAVDVYSGYNNLGNFHVRYENLNDDKLMEVFDLIMEVYEDGKLNFK